MLSLEAKIEARPWWEAKSVSLVRICTFWGLMFCLSSSVYAGESQKHFVIPAGQEDRIESLIKPYQSDGPVGSGRLRGISVQKDEIQFALEGVEGTQGTLVLAHKKSRKAGDREFASFTARLKPVSGFSLPQKEAELLFEAIARNDKGDFPWRIVEADDAPPPNRAGFGVEVEEVGGTGGILAWFQGTGFAMLLWVSLIFWGLWLLARNKAEWLRDHTRRDSYFWATMGIVVAGIALRLLWAPEAIYKEAHPFRGLEAVFIPITQPVAVSSSLPGYPALLQFLHGISGVHPIELLFWVNLSLGCALPLLAASIGKRIHEQAYAPVLYAGAAAFLPHAIKYSHSEVFTGPMAFLILLSLRAWLDCTLSRSYAIIACLSSALLAWIRPEAVLVLPGLAVLGLAGSRIEYERFVQTFKRCRKSYFTVSVVVALLVFPVLPRIWTMQASGQGIVSEDLRTLGQTIDSADVESFDGVGLSDLFSKVLSPEHNVFLNPDFTPVLWMALAILGLVWFVRRRPLWALGFFLCSLPLMLIYGLLVSSVESFGEMRYQLSLTSFFVIFSGAGATWLVQFAKDHAPEKLRGSNKELMPRFILVAFLLCLMPYRGLVAQAEHPAQQEFRVLRTEVLGSEKGWERGAFVAFPRRSKFILPDLRPSDMSPILVPRKYEMQAITWKDIPLYIDRGSPVFLYRGLYAHYLEKLNPRGKAWFSETWEAHFRTKGLELEVIFESEVPFIPHHSILDRNLGAQRFIIALYRVKKIIGSAL